MKNNSIDWFTYVSFDRDWMFSNLGIYSMEFCDKMSFFSFITQTFGNQ
jgi:hypothetical protein